MARAITWSYDPDYPWDHETPFKWQHETLMTIIVHPEKAGKKDIRSCHQAEFKQMDLFHSSSDGYYFENTTAKRKGRVIK